VAGLGSRGKYLHALTMGNLQRKNITPSAKPQPCTMDISRFSHFKMNALTKDDLKVDNTRLEKTQNLMLKAFLCNQKSPIDINTKKLNAQKLTSKKTLQNYCAQVLRSIF